MLYTHIIHSVPLPVCVAACRAAGAIQLHIYRSLQEEGAGRNTLNKHLVHDILLDFFFFLLFLKHCKIAAAAGCHSKIIFLSFNKNI